MSSEKKEVQSQITKEEAVVTDKPKKTVRKKSTITKKETPKKEKTEASEPVVKKVSSTKRKTTIKKNVSKKEAELVVGKKDKKTVGDIGYSGEHEEVALNIKVKTENFQKNETIKNDAPSSTVTISAPEEENESVDIKIQGEKVKDIIDELGNEMLKEPEEKKEENPLEGLPTVANEAIMEAKKDAQKIISPVMRVVVEETKNKNNAETTTTSEPIQHRHIKNIKIYKRIAYFFGFMLFLLVLAAFYITFVRVTITLIPNQERISNNLLFEVYDIEKQSDQGVTGVVREIEVSHKNKFTPTDEEVIGKEAVGKIEIVNNYIKSQPLVATTRVLSADGKLFRLKNTVNVPAGGSAEAEIYADEPSLEMAIGPTTFTIPGLWAGLQDKIFAQNKEKIEYRQKVKRKISKDDIDNSLVALKQELLNKAKEQVSESYNDYSNLIYKIDEESIVSTVDGKIGQEIDEFFVDMKAKVVVVAFNNDKASELAKEKLISSLLPEKELVSFDDENINYTLNKFDIANGQATINSTFEGKITLKDDSNIVDKEKLIGLNKGQIDAYLNEIDDLAGHEIEFFPSFIKSIPPVMETSRIEIRINR